MKPPVIVLSLICAALAATLFVHHRSGQRALEAANAAQQTCSNELVQARTKLVQAQGESIHTQTNLQTLIDRRTAELLNASNVVVHVRGMLASTQKEATRISGELQSVAQRIGALEGQRDELARKLEIVQPLDKQLAEVRQQLQFAVGDRDMLLKESQRLQLENAELERNLTDLGFLRIQTTKVEENLETTKRLAQAKPGSRPDLRLPLVLEPDGTVRLATPAPAPAEK